MVLLNIYIGTILFSVIATFVATANIISECKRKFGKENWETLSKCRFPRQTSMFGLILDFTIPIWNVYFGLVMTYCYRQIADEFIKKHEDAWKEMRGVK